MPTNTNQTPNFQDWNETELEAWFKKAEWKQGWKATPDSSTDIKEFAAQYFKNQERWNKAFQYLAETDLEKLEPGKYKLEEDALVVNINEYKTRNEEDTKYEAHLKYADIQYLVNGKELIGVLPLEKMSEITVSYDEDKDLIFYGTEEKNDLIATPENFFVFFPHDTHKPCLKLDANENVKKVVVKVLLD